MSERISHCVIRQNRVSRRELPLALPGTGCEYTARLHRLKKREPRTEPWGTPFTHVLQPWNFLDINQRSCMCEPNHSDWTLNRLYPASSLVQSPCNVQLSPCVNTAGLSPENSQQASRCVDDVSIMQLALDKRSRRAKLHCFDWAWMLSCEAIAIGREIFLWLFVK